MFSMLLDDADKNGIFGGHKTYNHVKNLHIASFLPINIWILSVSDIILFVNQMRGYLRGLCLNKKEQLKLTLTSIFHIDIIPLFLFLLAASDMLQFFNSEKVIF